MNFKRLFNFTDYMLFLENSSTVDLYFEEVKLKLIDLLKSKHNLNDTESNEFIDNLFSMGKKRSNDIKSIVKEHYSRKDSVQACSLFILDKYYGIVKMNNTVDNNLEITEVNENKFYHFKKVSNSLFWNFIQRINKIETKFNFDLSNISDLTNSLNKSGYLVYLETDKVSKLDVEYEFSHSRLLSDIIKYIDVDDIKFYIGIQTNEKNQLRFGYLVGDKVYTFGKIEYKSTDIKRLSKSIKTNGIDFTEISIKFKKTLLILNYYKDIFSKYLGNYKGDIDIYLTVIDNKIVLVIDSRDIDVVNDKYLCKIMDSHTDYKTSKGDLELNFTNSRNSVKYFITLK